jgi:hypothetical protein
LKWGNTSTLGDFWSSAVFLPFFAVVFAVLWLIRQRIVKPRVGVVIYGSWRKSRMMRFNVLMLLILVFASILGGLSVIRFDSVPGWVHNARFSLVFLIGFSLAGYYLDFPRLFVYGVLVALAPLIGELLYKTYKIPHHGYPVTFDIVSGFIMITGVVLFIRLLRDYPLNAQMEG